MKEISMQVVKNEEIAKNIFSLTLKANEKLVFTSGQFLNLSLPASDKLLKRPFGICGYGKDETEVVICYQVVGDGTMLLSNVKCGTELNVTFPLGNGFSLLKEEKNVALIGGGAGAFPLNSLKDNYKDKNFYAYLGFRNNEAVCLEDSFKNFCKEAKFCTDDGSKFVKNNAVDLFLEDLKNKNIDVILACGPKPMLKALKDKLVLNNVTIKTFVSLEERMGCGIGACLVCTCKTKSGDRKRICKDGPVFDVNEVEL